MGAAVGLLSVLGVGPASAYHLEGPRWGGTPTSGCCANIHVQYASGFYPDDQVAYNSAIIAWNQSAANVLLVSGSSKLTIDDVINNSVTWDGITNYTYSGSSFTAANVLLNYHFTIGYDSSKTKGVAAHELGHALGLAHTSGCVLMTPDTPTRSSCGISGPTSDDVNGVNHLY
jgi:predicted Zn-dependent protease